MGYNVAVVGATGNVGREMLNILAERSFPADEVVALTEITNDRSRAVMERLGMRDPREITFNGEPFVVYTLPRPPTP